MKQRVIDIAVLERPLNNRQDDHPILRYKRNSHSEMDSVIVVQGLKKKLW